VILVLYCLLQEHEGLKVVKVEHGANKGLIEKYKVGHM
jgi:hypothetical protein